MIWPAPLATLIGAVGAFVFGAIYYGALGKPWMRAAGIAPEDAKMGPALFAISFVLILIMSAGVGSFLATMGITNSIPSALAVTAIFWFSLVLAPMAVNHRYQGRGWSLTAIDSLHWLGVLLILAAVHIVMAGAPKVTG